MATRQLLLMLCFYLVLLSAAVYVTRAIARRIVGAFVGGAIIGLINIGMITFGEARGWWHVPIRWEPGYMSLLLLLSAIAGAFVFLLTWRIARRFGWRGVAAAIVVAAIIGPVRTYLAEAVFPEWITLGPGIAPVLAVASSFAILIAAGHAVMRLIAGPAQLDQLARRHQDTT